jgi:hypothetical protein
VKEENKRKNMEEELSHADESLKAASLLIDSQLFREAIPKLNPLSIIIRGSQCYGLS